MKFFLVYSNILNCFTIEGERTRRMLVRVELSMRDIITKSATNRVSTSYRGDYFCKSLFNIRYLCL